MERKPLLSIVIATKNRVKYCKNCIETILKYPDTDFELIIQDNTDNFDLQDYVASNISDSRLVYNYTPPPFSSIANFNAALELANGEYVCLIGDDDGVCSTLFEVVRWAKLNDIDSICPNVFVDYYWPGAFKPDGAGFLTLPYFSKKVWEKDPRKDIQSLINDGAINYMRFNLPKFYHGLVRKACFEEIKKVNGYYIGGLSPDIYSAVSLSNVVKEHVVIDFPLTIAGACKASTTVAGATGGHSGKLESAPHFRDRGEYLWDKQVPKYYSVQTIWAESALKAIHENGISVNFSKLNVAKILAKSIIDAPSHYKLFISEALKTSNDSHFFFYLKLVYQMISNSIMTYFLKVFNKLLSLSFKKSIRMINITDIDEATIQVNDLIKILNIKKILESRWQTR